MRLKGFPFDECVADFIEEHEYCFVVEQNRDAQMLSLLKLDLEATLVGAIAARHWGTSHSASVRKLGEGSNNANYLAASGDERLVPPIRSSAYTNLPPVCVL